MRSSSVADLKRLARHYKIKISEGPGIDVGGTKEVHLDGKTQPNPLLKILPSIVFLDRGFNIDTLNTNADEVLDFLDNRSIQHLKSRFKLVFSFDTLEHVSNPLRFCENLILITQPGGYIYLATVFDWPYHPSPEDYYRYSPSGLRELFSNSFNHLSKQAEIIWSGWGSDLRGVCIIIRKKTFDEKGREERLSNNEHWLLNRNKRKNSIVALAAQIIGKIFNIQLRRY